MAHEVSVTFPIGDRWVNAPSIVNGRQLSEDAVRDLVISGKLQPHGSFSSQVEAVKAAKLRSDQYRRPSMANGLLNSLVAQRDNLLTQGASLGEANAAVFNMLQQGPAGRFGPNEAQLSRMLSQSPAGAGAGAGAGAPLPRARPSAPVPNPRPSGARPELPTQASPVAGEAVARRGPPDLSSRFRTPAGVGLENIPRSMQRPATAADARPSNLAGGGDPLGEYVQWAQAHGLAPGNPQTMAIYEGVRASAPAREESQAPGGTFGPAGEAVMRSLDFHPLKGAASALIGERSKIPGIHPREVPTFMAWAEANGLDPKNPDTVQAYLEAGAGPGGSIPGGAGMMRSLNWHPLNF